MVIIWFASMKHDLRVRIIVSDPPARVWMKVQKGKDELLDPEVLRDGSLRFEFLINVDLTSGKPNFLGRFAHGPKDARFIYVNSGTYAGQHGTNWARRAKLSLMAVTAVMVNATVGLPSRILETTIKGTGKDGGPVCASVKGLEWKVAPE